MCNSHTLAKLCFDHLTPGDTQIQMNYCIMQLNLLKFFMIMVIPEH